LTIFIQALGILDVGKKETWIALEKALLERFDQLNLLDFEMAL